MAVRTLSIRAVLDASTVTPGSTAPVASLTTPAIAPVWAVANAGRRRQRATATTDVLGSMIPPWHPGSWLRRDAEQTGCTNPEQRRCYIRGWRLQQDFPRLHRF